MHKFTLLIFMCLIAFSGAVFSNKITITCPNYSEVKNNIKQPYQRFTDVNGVEWQAWKNTNWAEYQSWIRGFVTEGYGRNNISYYCYPTNTSIETFVRIVSESIPKDKCKVNGEPYSGPKSVSPDSKITCDY